MYAGTHGGGGGEEAAVVVGAAASATSTANAVAVAMAREPRGLLLLLCPWRVRWIWSRTWSRSWRVLEECGTFSPAGTRSGRPAPPSPPNGVSELESRPGLHNARVGLPCSSRVSVGVNEWG